MHCITQEILAQNHLQRKSQTMIKCNKETIYKQSHGDAPQLMRRLCDYPGQRNQQAN